MTQKLFLSLLEINEVSLPLVDAWKRNHHECPVDSVLYHKRFARFCGWCVGPMFTTLFIAIVLEIVFWPEATGEWLSGPVVAGISMLGCIAFFFYEARKHARYVPEFAVRIEELKGILQLNYGQIATASFDELKKNAGEKLVKQARHVIEYQNLARGGGTSAMSVKNAMNGANAARDAYDKMHTTCATLGLVEKEWDSIFRRADKEEVEAEEKERERQAIKNDAPALPAA